MKWDLEMFMVINWCFVWFMVIWTVATWFLLNSVFNMNRGRIG